MTIDIYHQCPCHEDKKLKFCCGKSIVQELNEALSKHESGQSQAALEQLNRAIQSIAPKDCLTPVKTFIQISNKDIEGAKETNDAFLNRCPDHPTGLQHRSIIQLMSGQVDQAAITLQDAVDAIKGTELPVALAMPFDRLGIVFAAGRNILAARAHLNFALFLKEQDQRLERLMHELHNPPGASLFLKADHRLDPPVEGSEWEKPYLNVHRAVDRGQFRRALGMLLSLNEQFPNELAITKGIAVVTSMFAPVEAQAAAWRTVAAMPGLNLDDAIEYHGLAEALDVGSNEDDFIDVNRCSWDLEDFDRALENCISNDCLVPIDPAPPEDPFNEGPAPRSSYLVMDKPNLRSAEGITIEQVPFSVGELFLFGKQTDRPARAEFVSIGNDRFDASIGMVKEHLGLDDDPLIAELDKVGREADAITWNWKLPDDTTQQQHNEFLSIMKRRALDRWSDIKQSLLDGKSMREAAAETGFEAAVQARLLGLQYAANGEAFDDEEIDALRKELGVAELELLVPAEDEALTPVQMCRIDAEKLGDDQLRAYLEIALMMHNYPALRRLTPEALNREHLEGVRRDVCHVHLARQVKDQDEALEHFAKARAEAGKLNVPIGIYLVAEFEYRLRNGLEDKLDSLLDTIQSRHIDEPGVREELARLFQSIGIHPGASRPEESEPAPAETAAVESTPGGKETASGLWIPD